MKTFFYYFKATKPYLEGESGNLARAVEVDTDEAGVAWGAAVQRSATAAERLEKSKRCCQPLCQNISHTHKLVPQNTPIFIL